MLTRQADAESVDVCSITDIPSVIESEMQQNLQRLLSTACPADRVHDVLFQVQCTRYFLSIFTTSRHRCWRRNLSADVEKVSNCSTAQEKDKLNDDNYRGMNRLSHGGKVIWQRIRQRMEEILTEAQAQDQQLRCSQTYSRNIFRIHLCLLQYYDSQKVFNNMWKVGLWRVMWFLRYDDTRIK